LELETQTMVQRHFAKGEEKVFVKRERFSGGLIRNSPDTKREHE